MHSILPLKSFFFPKNVCKRLSVQLKLKCFFVRSFLFDIFAVPCQRWTLNCHQLNKALIGNVDLFLSSKTQSVRVYNCEHVFLFSFKVNMIGKSFVVCRAGFNVSLRMKGVCYRLIFIYTYLNNTK